MKFSSGVGSSTFMSVWSALFTAEILSCASCNVISVLLYPFALRLIDSPESLFFCPLSSDCSFITCFCLIFRVGSNELLIVSEHLDFHYRICPVLCNFMVLFVMHLTNLVIAPSDVEPQRKSTLRVASL